VKLAEGDAAMKWVLGGVGKMEEKTTGESPGR
jgi:hypothetical protein